MAFVIILDIFKTKLWKLSFDESTMKISISCSPNAVHKKPQPYLHGPDEGGEVGGSGARVPHDTEVVDAGGAAVPVHHHHVGVPELQQLHHHGLQPIGRRPGGPEAVDDEGGGPCQV